MLPSVAPSSDFSSTKLRRSLAARALTMPRRVRSWMTASSCADRAIVRRAAGRDAASVRGEGAASATVTPRDNRAEEDVQAAKADAEQPGRPAGGREEGDRADGHEAEAKGREDAHGERAGSS